MDKNTENIITDGIKTLAGRAQEYEAVEMYYKGKHKLAFASANFRSAFGDTFREFADNLMPPVVDAVKDNLLVTGFNVEAGAAGIADRAWAVWQRNRMNQRAGEVHKEALLKGDAYVVVWADAAGRATMHPNKAHLCTVNYDEEQAGVVSSAVKMWKGADKRFRLNVYFPDRIEKYITRASYPNGMPDAARAFIEYEIAGEAYPMPNPYGVVPVFHFANNAALGESGRSELSDVMPLQDALNKAVTDKMVAMEFTAYTQRYAIGLDVETDPATGKPIQAFSGMERWLTVASENVKFGQFEGANLEQFLKVQNDFRMEIARVSGTPLHYFFLQTGSLPSGEALKTLEKRFLKKTIDRQTSFGEAWEAAMGFALRIEGESEKEKGENSDLRLFTQWSDPSPASQREVLENLLMKSQIGVDDFQLLVEAGYGLKDIDAMMKRKAARAAEASDEFNFGELAA